MAARQYPDGLFLHPPLDPSPSQDPTATLTMSGGSKGTGAARTARRSKEEGQIHKNTIHPTGVTNSSTDNGVATQAPEAKGHRKVDQPFPCLYGVPAGVLTENQRSGMADSRQNDHAGSAPSTKGRKKLSQSEYQRHYEKTYQPLPKTIIQRKAHRANQ